MNELVRANVAVLRQGERLLRQLDDAAYRHCAELVFSSTVGAHVRHALDHYTCLLDGLEASRVDYEPRRRDPVIETDRLAAVSELTRTCELIEIEQRFAMDHRLLVRGGAVHSHEWAVSSVRRELEFALSHTVHHYALVAVICGLQGIRTEPGFGVAPSTLRYWASLTTELAS